MKLRDIAETFFGVRDDIAYLPPLLSPLAVGAVVAVGASPSEAPMAMAHSGLASCFCLAVADEIEYLTTNPVTNDTRVPEIIAMGVSMFSTALASVAVTLPYHPALR